MTHEKSWPLRPCQTHHSIRPSQCDLASLQTASTLVLSCIDFRLRDGVTRFLNHNLHLQDDYDEMALPGASLAFITEAKPHWTQTVDDVIGIAQKLHHVKRIVFIDHMGCGAYRALLGESMIHADKEKEAHIHTLHKARKKAEQAFPGLEVSTWLMSLNGEIVEYVPNSPQSVNHQGPVHTTTDDKPHD